MTSDSATGSANLPPFQFIKRIEFRDALIFLCILVLVRQYFWLVPNNAIAWLLTVCTTTAIFWVYVRSKPFSDKGVSWQFWLIAILPLVFIYVLRVPFPDLSFDVLNYRLVHSERSLRGPLFIHGDFFPTPAPYNPAPDTLTGLFRIVLGYRLGTIVNLLALIWCALVIDKILRLFIRSPWLRSLGLLLVLFTEHVLFEINNYMVDLLTLPLLLEATYFCLRLVIDRRSDATEEQTVLKNAGSIYPHAALLLGLSVAMKLTNVTTIAPLAFVLVYLAIRDRKKVTARQCLLSVLALSAPILPFTIYLWRLTGNPIFPLGNTIFKSPFWHTTGGWDARWGPAGILETVVWPAIVSLKPERHSELAVYSGRLSIGFVVAFLALLLAWRCPRVRLLALLFLTGCLIWSAAALGYSRYGLYLELLAGIVILVFIANLIQAQQQRWKPLLAAVFLIVLIAQCVLAGRYTLKYEWSNRPTMLSNPRSFKQESRYLLRDRSLEQFLPNDQRAMFSAVDFWIQSSPKSSGLEVLLNHKAPIVSVDYWEYFATRRPQKQFIAGFIALPSRHMYSLIFPEDLKTSLDLIRKRGLEIGDVTEIRIPYFSLRNEIHMMLVSVSLPQDSQTRAQFENSWRQAPFADRDYRARITTSTPLTVLRAGQQATLQFRVANLGSEAWPAQGDSRGMYQVNIGDRWLSSDGLKVINDLDSRTALATDLEPGKEAQLSLTVTAPLTPGKYLLEIDMIHEAITFFHEKGSQPLKMVVTVEP